MTHESTITFTLDPICPWTYISNLRLSHALALYRSIHPSSLVAFHLRIAFYQLYPDFPFSAEGTSKYDWYLNERFLGNTHRMEKFLTSMSALGRDEGIAFDFQSGVIANSLHALRILFVLQNEFSPDKAFLALESLYEQYFERGKHPASSETLMMACDAAGLSTEEVRAIVQNEEKGRKEVQREIENQRGMGDSVPCVVFEGRKRNFREVGAKSVGEYGRILEQIEKEAV